MRSVVEVVAPARLGRPFRWLLANTWLECLGSGISLSAAPLLVASRGGDARIVALAAALQRLPWLLLSLPVGVLVDRSDSRRVVATADTTRALAALALGVAVVAGHAPTVAVLGAVLVVGTCEVFSLTAAFTMAPRLVRGEDLGLANARRQAGFWVLEQLVGPAVGAFLYAAAAGLPFLVQGSLLAASVLCVLRVPALRAPLTDAARHVGRELVEGLRWVARHGAVRTLVLTILVFNVTYGAAWSVLVLLAQHRLHLDAGGYGVLTALIAVGGVAGSLGYSRLSRLAEPGQLLRIGLVIETLTHIALALTTSSVVAGLVLVVFGAHAAVWGVISLTARQRAVPAALRGRVGAVNQLATQGGLVVGAAVAGPIADRYGVLGPFWFAGVGSALMVAAVWRSMRHLTDDPVPDDDLVGVT